MSFETPEQEHHTMEFVQTHEDGQDELYCPICGRRMLLSWPPKYKKVILEPGDEYAVHSGGKGGLQIGRPQIIEQEGNDALEDDRLGPWIDWMVRSNFRQLWE